MLLLYTVINECAGNYFHYCLHRPNFFLYNIYVPIEFGFYSLQIVLVLKANSRKRLILTSLLTGLLFSVWNIAFGKGLNNGYNTDTNILLSLLLIFASLVYLYDLLTYSEHIETPIREPMFWIVAGLLFFNFGCLIINALYDYAEAKHLTLFGKEIYSQIMKLLNLLMYSCFTISFVLCYRTRKSIC
ncbi:hypothetical protein GCM10023092_15160 [Rurimicrobium arvi]|uniref:Uncharacterized protein n=1 Tax=Rurimicrobium arvi TaxID=2049916 RepID=A0ABP8MSP0_9BACT